MADIFISKDMRKINKIDNKSLISDLLLLCLKSNQEIPKNNDKQKLTKRIGKKKKLCRIADLLNNDMVLKKLILAHKLLRSNIITMSELNVITQFFSLYNKFK